MMDPVDITYFATPAEFRAWMEAHHESRDALWVGFWKKGTPRASITWPESVDVALCFGWIDGIRKKVDDEAYTIRFTPRRAGSTWSLRNMERYTVMEGEGLIQPAGRAAYDRRIESRTGTYSFEQKAPLALDPDYETRIRADEVAWADWSARPPGYKKKVTHWIMSAKRPETRERRFEKLIQGLRDGSA